jgi:PAS domain S-box-containing protein
MPEKELRRINTVSRFLQLKISKEEQLQEIVELAAKICDSPIAMITFMDSERQYIKFSVGTDLKELSYQDSFCRYTIKQQDLFVIPDAEADERVRNNHFVAGDPGIRFYAGSPLTTHDEHNMGTLCVYDIQPKTLTAMQGKMLHRLGRQVMQLLEFDASLQLLKEQYEYSMKEETKLRSFFESCSSCHLLLDKELRVVSFNKALADLMEKTYHLPIAEGVNMVDFVQAEAITEFTKNCHKALHGEAVQVESVVAAPQGDVVWHLTYEPAFDSEVNIVGVSFCATDITQSVKHEKTVIGQEEAFRQIERIVSAELQQPIALVTEAMISLKQQGFPDHVEEFSLLGVAFDELSEKWMAI